LSKFVFFSLSPEEKNELDDCIDEELGFKKAQDILDSLEIGFGEFGYDAKFLRPLDEMKHSSDIRNIDYDELGDDYRDDDEFSSKEIDRYASEDEEEDDNEGSTEQEKEQELEQMVLKSGSRSKQQNEIHDLDYFKNSSSKKLYRENERNVRKTLGLYDFNDSDDEEDEEQLKQEMTEKEYQELFGDWEGIRKKVHERVYEINDDEDDPFDLLMDEAMLGSMKTRSGDYEILLDHPKRRRVHIPPARSMRQLQYSSMTRLTVDPASPGYAVGESVWGQLQKNMYFTGPQRFQFSNGIAKEYNNIMEAVAKTNPATIDGIYDPQFRKGLAYRKKLEAETKDQVQVGKKRAVKKVEQTDWSVEAVEDEDAL
jgi:hypothetical protein